jgi:tryptophanyl-tRNA synthetase
MPLICRTITKKLLRNNIPTFSPVRSPLSHLNHGLRPIATTSKKNPDQVIFSGIQPTGVPHLGNYLGALQQWVKLQNLAAPSTKLIFSIVDLHAITMKQDPGQLRRWKRESLATLLAVGLDPERSVLFYQSSVSGVLVCNGWVMG